MTYERDRGNRFENGYGFAVLDREHTADDVGANSSASVAEPAVDRRRPRQDVVKPLDWSLRIAAQRVAVATWKNDQIAGLEQDWIFDSFDFQPAAPLEKHMKCGLPVRFHREAPGRVHVRAAENRCPDAERPQHLTDAVAATRPIEAIHLAWVYHIGVRFGSGQPDMRWTLP